MRRETQKLVEPVRSYVRDTCGPKGYWRPQGLQGLQELRAGPAVGPAEERRERQAVADAEEVARNRRGITLLIQTSRYYREAVEAVGDWPVT